MSKRRVSQTPRSRERHGTQHHSVKSSVDNHCPVLYSHLTSRAKQMQKKRERLSQIQHDNMILVEKMRNIANSKRHSSILEQQQAVHARTRSLNSQVRAKRMERIERDNAMILKRIVSTQSVYDSKKWTKEAERNLNLIQNSCRFPYTIGKWDRKNEGKNNLKPKRPSGSSKRRPQTSRTPQRPLTSNAILKEVFSQQHHRPPTSNKHMSKKLFNDVATIEDTQCHIRVFEKQRPSRLDLKVYIPSTEMEYLLSLPFVQLKQCFPNDSHIFFPTQRARLIKSLIAQLQLVDDGHGNMNLELCVDLKKPQQSQRPSTHQEEQKYQQSSSSDSDDNDDDDNTEHNHDDDHDHEEKHEKQQQQEDEYVSLVY